jgi:hypothetical protein
MGGTEAYTLLGLINSTSSQTLDVMHAHRDSIELLQWINQTRYRHVIRRLERMARIAEQA